MPINYLPGATVQYLNAIYHEGQASAEARQAFREDLARAQSWLADATQFTLHDRDALDAENATYLWQSLSRVLDGPHSLEEVCAPLFEAAALMEDMRRRRWDLHFSTQPAIHRVILAGAAFVQGRGTTLAVQQAREAALLHVRRLQVLYLRVRHEFSAEIRGALLKGFALLRQGLRELTSPEREQPEAVRPALAAVKGGGELLQNLLDWEARQPRHPFQAIPGVSRDLALAVQAGYPLPQDFWSGQDQLWARLAPELLLSAQGEAPVEALEAALGAHDLQALAQGWSLLEQHRLRLEVLSDSPGLYGQALRGILAGATADVTLLKLLEQFPLDRDIAFPCMQYLESGERNFLHQAAQALMDRYGSTCQEWNCQQCESVNRLEDSSCTQCGASCAWNSPLPPVDKY